MIGRFCRDDILVYRILVHRDDKHRSMRYRVSFERVHARWTGEGSAGLPQASFRSLGSRAHSSRAFAGPKRHRRISGIVQYLAKDETEKP